MSTEQLTLSSLETESLHTQDQSQERDVTFPSDDQKKFAWLDIKEGIQAWQIWGTLGYQDIKQRYKRSMLGPLWITLSMAVTVYSMGFIYSQLFKTNLQDYYPFLVAGMIAWTFISTLILDFSEGFLNDSGLIKQIKLPYSLHIHRIAARNLLIFFHNLIVMIPIFFIFHQSVSLNLNTLFLIPALAIIYLSSIFFGLIIAMICARYRDIPPIIKSSIQVIFFITPVMWQPQSLIGKQHLIVDFNPLYAFLEMIRAPLLGNLPSLTNIFVVLIVTFLGFLLSFYMLTRYRKRIIYWL
jgi:lipopolysaccharide transport system permease protein